MQVLTPYNTEDLISHLQNPLCRIRKIPGVVIITAHFITQFPPGFADNKLFHWVVLPFSLNV